MNGIQLSVCLPGAAAGAIVNAARLAESFNLDLWIGDPHAQAPNCDDTYVMTTAAAVAAVTSHIRIGVFLTLSGSAQTLRLAEDIGVVDQASRGRLEIGMVVPGAAVEQWERRARQLLGAWHEWPAGDARSVSVTPRPAQPWLSRLVAGGAGVGPIADRLRGGVVVLDENNASSIPSGAAPQRAVLALAPELDAGGVRGWLADTVLERMVELRDRANRAGAHEVMFILPDAGPIRLAADLEALGIVVGTSLRCARHKLEFLAPDAWNWLTELRHLHHAPR